MADFDVPLIIRGKVITDYTLEHGDRSAAGRTFRSPDVAKYVQELVMEDPKGLLDLYTLSLSEIYDYLDELGECLDLDTNVHWREAFEISCHASNLSRPVLEHIYRHAPRMLGRKSVSDVVESRIGSQYLEGWVPTLLADGRRIEVRAVGCRGVHVIAGNIPIVPLLTVLRNAVTRNDTIVKLPSNDPLTTVAIARTMIDMAPGHPLTKHLSVAYWKGGDAAVEEKVYQPRYINKLVAWGGFTSVKHITKYLQPGIDLITLDPKSSTTLIGREALADEAIMREAAMRAASDIASFEQEACSNARVIFLESGTDAAGIEQANRFGEYVYEAIQSLPVTTTNGPTKFDPKLLGEIHAILPLDDFYKVFTSPQNIEKTGAVIVSQMNEQVDFPQLLYGRVGNIVPVDDIEEALKFFTAATQTVGVFPDSLRRRIRDRAAIFGGEALVPLGYSTMGSIASPQDGIEPERRMCRWVVDNHCDPAVVPRPWMHPEELDSIAPSRTAESAQV